MPGALLSVSSVDQSDGVNCSGGMMIQLYHDDILTHAENST